MEAILVPHEASGQNRVSSRGATGSVRGSIASSARGRQRQARVGSPDRRSPASTPSRKARRSCERVGRSWRRAVKHAPSRGWIAARRFGVARKNPTFGKGKDPAINAARAAGPEIERSHGCSCRESIAEVGERHLLRAIEGSREANRDAHGVARDGRSSLMGRIGTLRAKGCEDFRANVTGNAEGFARSQDRDRTGGRHPGLMGGVASNRVASSGVLATWGASTPDERREPRRRTRENGDLAVAPTGRQRVSEVATSGEAPPAEGRRGSAAAEKRLPGVTHERGDPGQDESRAAPDDKSQPKLPRRKTVASGCGSGSANCSTRNQEIGSVRRCHAAPQTPREGFAFVE